MNKIDKDHSNFTISQKIPTLNIISLSQGKIEQKKYFNKLPNPGNTTFYNMNSNLIQHKSNNNFNNKNSSFIFISSSIIKLNNNCYWFRLQIQTIIWLSITIEARNFVFLTFSLLIFINPYENRHPQLTFLWAGVL